MWITALFTLYYDIASILTDCKVSLYTDDTVLYISHTEWDTAVRLIQHDLNLLNEWCMKNRVTINCKKKKKYCVFGMKSVVKKNHTGDTIISLNEIMLDRVCSYKYLGFILDDRFSFNKHINE